MSNYTAIIRCDKCGKELAKINAYHNRPDMFVPQDIALWQYGLPANFCMDCLNGGHINERTNPNEDRKKE